jgi:hypothetical protein
MLRFVVRTFLSMAALLVVVLVVFALWDRTLRVLDSRAGAPHPDARRSQAPRSVEQTGFLPELLRESSGVAVSRAHPGVLWSHNDSGDGPMIYAVDLAGTLLATYRVAGANAVDWEDMSLGPCPDSLVRRDCLYVGDVGDNSLRRPAYNVVILPEPEPQAGNPQIVGVVDDARRLAFTYVDGSHDTEALAVSGAGDVFLVTKGLNGRVQLFRIPVDAVRTALASGTSATAQITARLPIEPRAASGRMVTGASISPSGTTLAVRTYTEIFFFALGGDGSVSPSGPPCFLGILEPQGEALDFLDEQTLVVTSETARGRQGTIHRVRCAAGARGE